MWSHLKSKTCILQHLNQDVKSLFTGLLVFLFHCKPSKWLQNQIPFSGHSPVPLFVFLATLQLRIVLNRANVTRFSFILFFFFSCKSLKLSTAPSFSTTETVWYLLFFHPSFVCSPALCHTEHLNQALPVQLWAAAA